MDPSGRNRAWKVKVETAAALWRQQSADSVARVAIVVVDMTGSALVAVIAVLESAFLKAVTIVVPARLRDS